ncbi:MAG: hypothetical protein Q9226_001432 [Calogaya cf. arnoldii]
MVFDDAANRSSGNTEALGWRDPERDVHRVKARQQNSSDDGGNGNPFYPDVVDLESVSTDRSEEPYTFAHRLKHLIRRRRKEDDGYSDDYEVDQIVKSLDNYIVGYPKVAAFANADPSFLIYRKFGWLHNRSLLYLQDEIVALEHKLNKLDQRTFAHEDEVKLKSRREDIGTPGMRRDTFKQIAEKLKEYGQCIRPTSQIRIDPGQMNIYCASRKSKP